MAENEFAASVMRQLRRPIRLYMFTTDVAVDEQNEIAKDFFCMLAHSQGTFCRVVHFRINTTAPAVGLSRVPQKTTKPTLRIMWYHMLVSCCTNPTKKKEKKTRLVLVRPRTAVKMLRRQHGKNQIQPCAITFSNLSDNVAVLRQHENCGRFATL